MGRYALGLHHLPTPLHYLPPIPAQDPPERGGCRVGGADVGTAPVDVSRHAGSYKLVLRKPGFDPYESDVTVKPGEEANLRANLKEEKIPITKPYCSAVRWN